MISTDTISLHEVNSAGCFRRSNEKWLTLVTPSAVDGDRWTAVDPNADPGCELGRILTTPLNHLSESSGKGDGDLDPPTFILHTLWGKNHCM